MNNSFDFDTNSSNSVTAVSNVPILSTISTNSNDTATISATNAISSAYGSGYITSGSLSLNGSRHSKSLYIY